MVTQLNFIIVFVVYFFNMIVFLRRLVTHQVTVKGHNTRSVPSNIFYGRVFKHRTPKQTWLG